MQDLSTLPGEPELRPLPKRKAAEVRRSRVSDAGCAVAALVALVLVGLVSNALFRAFSHPARWLLPTAVVGAGLLWLELRARPYHAKLRRDLDGGMMAVRRLDVVDAIEVEDPEDLGPAYFLLTREGSTLYFAGQYLEGYRRRGFPWTSFEVREGPESHEFFGLHRVGERLVPSLRDATPDSERGEGARHPRRQLPDDPDRLRGSQGATRSRSSQSPRPASLST